VSAPTRVQLCGRLLAEVNGRRVEDDIRGRQGRLLFAYLVVNRGRALSRDELIDAVWSFEPPARPDAALSTLLSNLRGALGRDAIEGRSELQLVLPAGAWVDLEAAAEAIAAAQAALARGDWKAAQDPARLALRVAEQGFLPGHDAPWVDVRARDLEELMLEALESVAAVGVRVGGSELVEAERAARRLVELGPLRESGHVALMEVAEARGNVAEGLQAFEELRTRLREELGAAPGAGTQEVFARLLEASGAAAPEIPVAAPERRAPLPALLDAPHRSRFVGRERELARLEVAVDRARDMPRQLVLVGGEPGIGKTRLLSHFGCLAHERGALVLYGRADEDGLVAYGPFTEALRHLVAHMPQPAVRRGAELGGSELRALVPELDAIAGAPAPSRKRSDPAIARFRLFDAIAALLVEAGREGPVVLLVDDLHWADEPTTLLLKHVLRAPEQRHLLAVATYRDAELHRARAVTGAIADLQRDVPLERIQVRGLAVPHVASLARDTTGREPSSTLVRSIHEETEGNPFFVLELSRHLAEMTAEREEAETDVPAAALLESVGLPEGVRDVIRRRLGQLSEDAQRALRLGAVLGREFDVDVVERIGDVKGERLIEAMEEAEEARVVGELPDRPERLTFSHALIRTTLYSEIAAPRRLRLHERIGKTLEELQAAGRAVGMAEIASHLLGALPRGDPERAVSAACRAAEEATHLFAYEEAAGHLARALDALERHLPDDARRRALLLIELGHAQRRSGRMPEARETFLRGIDAARELDDPELLAQAVLGYGGGFFESAYVDPMMIALLEEALAVIGGGDGFLRLELLSRLAKALYYSEDPRDDPRRAALTEEALGMAERLEDPMAMLVALEGRHFALTRPENLGERLATACRIIEMGRELGDPERELLGRYFLIADLVELGDFDAVDREIAEYGQQSERARLPLHRWYHARFLAMRAILDGRLDEAAATAQEALAHGTPVEPRTATMHFGAQIWLIHRLQGRLSELEEPVREFVAAYPRVPAWRMGLAHVLLAQGRRGEAEDVFREFTQSRFQTIPRDAIWSTTVSLAADLVAAGLGGPEEARDLYDLLAPYADRFAVTGEAIFSNGPVSLYLGLMALVMGQAADAVEHLEHALAEAHRVNATPFAVLARLALAGALGVRAAPGDADLAAELAESAEAGARQLGLGAALPPQPDPREPVEP
jgi:DNA-binding SARP family transcriptional activator/tetratricopeptide (TPR) repeat protein